MCSCIMDSMTVVMSLWAIHVDPVAIPKLLLKLGLGKCILLPLLPNEASEYR